MSSSADIKRKLIQILLDYGMRDTDRRNKILDTFGRIAPEIRDRIPYAVSETPLSAVESIINKCLEFEEDGIEQFTYAVFLSEGGGATLDEA